MTTRNRQDTVKMLSFVLEEILGENGLGLLGTYELLSGTSVVGTSPAIGVNYPLMSVSQNLSATSPKNTSKRVIPESGIECIINTDPDMMSSFFRQTNRQSVKYYEIVLDQHNPTEGLAEAVEAIVVDYRLYIQEEPVIRPATWELNGSGVLPARALLYHQQTKFLV